jgi:hypothetical protein
MRSARRVSVLSCSLCFRPSNLRDSGIRGAGRLELQLRRAKERIDVHRGGFIPDYLELLEYIWSTSPSRNEESVSKCSRAVSHARSLSVHARDGWSTRAAPSRRPRRRTRTDLRFRSLAEKRVCAYSPPAGEPFGGPSAQPPHNKGPTRGVRTCPHWARREDRRVLQRSEDARRGFVALPGRCWRLGYSRQVQATDRRETPLWTGRWFSPRGALGMARASAELPDNTVAVTFADAVDDERASPRN